MKFASLFLFIYSIILTLSPSVRLQSWNVSLRWDHWIGFILWLGLFTFTHRQICKFFPERDPFLLPIGAILSGWGLLTVWRLSSSFGLRQTIWLAISLVIVNLLIRVPNTLMYLWRYKYIWLTGGLLLTAMTFFLGTYPGGVGPRLWLGCCGVYLQPSEPLKLLLIAYLAAFLADRIPIKFTLPQIIVPTLVMTGLVLLLLLAQRDLGTAVLFIAIYASILYVATRRKRVVIFGVVIFLLAIILGYHFLSIVQVRFDSWLNPWLDPSGKSYQIVQSLITIASGGVLGRGPGLGNPSLVPVAQSDFIFSAISEETGLFGSIGLMLIICLFVVRGLQTALRASDLYKRYLATGLTIYIGVQSLLIIGGNLGIFPLTGITLPFISYGGSSLLTSFLSLLLLLSISNQTELDPINLPYPKPYLQVGGVLLAGFFSVILINGWWSIWASSSLLSRNDNPRRSISDIYVKRGAIIDRDGNPLVSSMGSPGEYSIVTNYPPLSPVLGYTDLVYGQAGLEQSLDPYLRGLMGYAPLDILWNQLLFSHPPPGLDVRLSISLSLQKQADDLLGANVGAIILLNARSGEILVMASHPYFDANTLNQTWADVVKNAQTPLLNRVTLGLYPPGTALAPFFLADLGYSNLPSLPSASNYAYRSGSISLSCSLPIQNPPTWDQLVADGCPGAILSMTAHDNPQHIESVLTSLGFYSVPSLPLPSDSSLPPSKILSIGEYALGQEGLTVSPLQMVMAAAALTANGKLPNPLLAMSVNIPQQGWSILNTGSSPVQVLIPDQAVAAVQALTVQAFPGWQSIGTAISGSKQVLTWYLGGTIPAWQGSPFAITVLLESNNPVLAEQIGQSLIKAVQNP